LATSPASFKQRGQQARELLETHRHLLPTPDADSLLSPEFKDDVVRGLIEPDARDAGWSYRCGQRLARAIEERAAKEMEPVAGGSGGRADRPLDRGCDPMTRYLSPDSAPSRSGRKRASDVVVDESHAGHGLHDCSAMRWAGI
jgi:hypothetical protein